MRRLVAIKLKPGKFQAADKGQMELYLRWLDTYEKPEREKIPSGPILCANASYRAYEAFCDWKMVGGMSHGYLTDLPPQRLLEAKLHEAIRTAHEQIAVRESAEYVPGLPRSTSLNATRWSDT